MRDGSASITRWTHQCILFVSFPWALRIKANSLILRSVADMTKNGSWFVIGQLAGAIALNELHQIAPMDFRLAIYTQVGLRNFFDQVMC